MGLLQRAVENYDCSRPLAGVYREDHEPLAPVGHTLTSANLEITIDRNGRFREARKVDKSEPKILIPVTEESNGRTSALSPHPLCEQLKYLVKSNEKANEMYVAQLRDWVDSEYAHPMLRPILQYIESGTILSDLTQSGVLSLNAKGVYDEKLLVRWRVLGLDETQSSACWMHQTLFQAFTEYYLRKISDRRPALCMIEGKTGPAASQHPKGIIPINGNAKLISANDSSGFTYRGRFTDDWQAATIGYVASQKAHNALRWLAAEQGVNIGGRVFLCWNPQGKTLPKPMGGLRPTQSQARWLPSDYQEELRNTLFSFKQDAQLKGNETAVLAAFDAATTGRLSVTYYNELSVAQFLQRMHDWDKHCCWYTPFGIQAPPLWQIVDCAFGTQRGAFLETDDKIKRQHIQRLLDFKLSGGSFPLDMVQALVERASMPLAYDTKNWRRIVSTACAALQKYRYDTKQGGDEMAWELDKQDRSFQFGRLLAVMECAEADFLQSAHEERQTNAIKFMSEFRQRPWHVFERINLQLHKAYLPRIALWQKNRYERLVGEITSILKDIPEVQTEADLNTPLKDIYLMGYELQRNDFFTKKEKTESEEHENGNSEQ